ncbi:MAG TPA: pyridoxal-phosphate dependent enzyme [Acidimicrobiia bacterium]|nr:pyridoxal-phosphate dependent enzyme [Acidimicrobiia bacterium]
MSDGDGLQAEGMWRYAELLPVRNPDSVVSLGEGGTPLLPATGPRLSSLAVGGVHMKAEHRNPTGSFKDRIAAVATALIRQDGLAGAVGTSSGNGGAAIAAYGARAGFPVILFTTSGIVDGKLEQILAHGGRTHVVEHMGTGGSTGGVAPTIAALAAETGWLPFLTGDIYMPEAMRGAETIAFELSEQVPGLDAIYVPVGGGGLLGSIYRGYRRLGGRIPRIIGVQPAGCPTFRRAAAGHLDPLPDPVTTTISGLQVAVLFDHGGLAAIEAGHGRVVEVTDEQAWEAQRLLAREEGVFVEPAGATALAGLLSDADDGRIDADDQVAVILSGAGHKDPVSARRVAGTNHPVGVTADSVGDVFARIRTELA